MPCAIVHYESGPANLLLASGPLSADIGERSFSQFRAIRDQHSNFWLSMLEFPLQISRCPNFS